MTYVFNQVVGSTWLTRNVWEYNITFFLYFTLIKLHNPFGFSLFLVFFSHHISIFYNTSIYLAKNYRCKLNNRTYVRSLFCVFLVECVVT